MRALCTYTHTNQAAKLQLFFDICKFYTKNRSKKTIFMCNTRFVVILPKNGWKTYIYYVYIEKEAFRSSSTGLKRKPYGLDIV